MSISGDVLKFYKKIFLNKLAAGTSGNVSFYDREKNQIWITPSSVDTDLMQENDIVVIDPDGNKLLENTYAPSSEWRLHAALYKHDSRNYAVVHTHSPYATAFAVKDVPIPRILVEMDFFTDGEVPVSRFAKCGTNELAENVVAQMNGRYTCLMQNHGAVAAGRTLEEAFKRVEYIEDAAKIAYYAQCLDLDKLNAISIPSFKI